jgi:hypothetical protein
MEAIMTNVLFPRSLSALLLAASLALGLTAFSWNSAAAQIRPAVGSIEVDVSELRAKGLGGFADMIGDAVRRELQAHYPSTSQGARLVVSLESVFLTGSPGIERDSFGGIGGFAPQDTLSGMNYLVGRDGRVIETYPLTVHSTAADAGPTIFPLERERAVILAQTYAQWLVRRF